jgi:hypothetical protein
VVPPESWDKETVKQWLVGQATQIHNGKEISASKDLFEQGFDR